MSFDLDRLNGLLSPRGVQLAEARAEAVDMLKRGPMKDAGDTERREVATILARWRLAVREGLYDDDR